MSDARPRPIHGVYNQHSLTRFDLWITKVCSNGFYYESTLPHQVISSSPLPVLQESFLKAFQSTKEVRTTRRQVTVVVCQSRFEPFQNSRWLSHGATGRTSIYKIGTSEQGRGTSPPHPLVVTPNMNSSKVPPLGLVLTSLKMY